MPTSLPYEEPSLIRLLVFSSFLYLLNLARIAADFLLHGGIVAEIALGIIYGSPLAALLPIEWEETFTVLGYLGLILVVFQGGLSSNLPMLLSNLPLSTVCALVGVGVPIAFSFALLNAAFGYKPLEAFAAGAALSSTSLGTTLAALNSQSRIGTVLISAAIIDDVVGLVIAAVIPALALVQFPTSQSGNSGLAWTIIRPLLSSVLIAAIAPLVARFILRPLFWYHGVGELGWGSEKHADAVKLFLMVVTVSAMAAISYYTSTSILYGAYIAGLILTYISQPPSTPSRSTDDAERTDRERRHKQRTEDLSFEAASSRLVSPVQEHVLLPLFFASIGFAIPFLDLWKPKIIWRGIVYSILMCLAKLAVGLPILSRSEPLHEPPPPIGDSKPEPRVSPSPSPPPPPTPPRILTSTPAAVFMGVAMVARGEIGLLIAQLARSSPSSGSPGLLGEEPFLLCIWAILVCTLVGPISLGLIVRRWGARVNAGVWA
ncbi:Sodium/hydrogen exchanger [Trametes versicolor FP-101664 SS1]|uniref:Sodium/hydrogen exchanger n=1 Tax=Trametes versicolor (strain FP-101664) TaxID=717944 RepID=UPI0004623E90|nr:Sodium/hydrogen exchanger [Trametes versicolor FP-101664 SS1]EIW62307.1 Sodium/hydrogen exchanger [Trametes versicolor FP-101664 SS1]